jgi:hypothetical protein
VLREFEGVSLAEVDVVIFSSDIWACWGFGLNGLALVGRKECLEEALVGSSPVGEEKGGARNGGERTDVAVKSKTLASTLVSI